MPLAYAAYLVRVKEVVLPKLYRELERIVNGPLSDFRSSLAGGPWLDETATRIAEIREQISVYELVVAHG